MQAMLKAYVASHCDKPHFSHGRSAECTTGRGVLASAELRQALQAPAGERHRVSACACTSTAVRSHFLPLQSLT